MALSLCVMQTNVKQRELESLLVSSELAAQGSDHDQVDAAMPLQVRVVPHKACGPL